MVNEPLEWNELSGAAAWLSEKTGESWSQRRLLDAALRVYPLQLEDGQFVGRDPVTLISAPPPIGVKHRLRTLPILEWPEPDIPPSIAKVPDKPPRLTCIRLRYTQVRDLISASWCEVHREWHEPKERGDENFKPTFLEAAAPYVVTSEVCGLWRDDLLKLAEYIERLRSTQQAAPVVAESAPAWKEKAQQRAREIIARQKEKDLYPSQQDVADEIAREFRAAEVVGEGGKPLTGAYIKRHALKGISSAQNRALSTSIRRGK